MVTAKLQCNLWLSMQLTWRLSGLYSADRAVFRCIFKNSKSIPGSLKYGRGQTSLKDVYCDGCMGGWGKAAPIPRRNSQEERRMCQVAKSWDQVNNSWKYIEKFPNKTSTQTGLKPQNTNLRSSGLCGKHLGSNHLISDHKFLVKYPLIVNSKVCWICKLLTITFYTNYMK